MATTTKTLTPTGQTITLPDMTERPNASVLVDGIGKDADAINTLDTKIGALITTDSFTTESQEIAAGNRGVFTANVSKTGYTPIGIIQIALANNWLEIGSFNISGNTAQVVLHNKGSAAQSTTITVAVLYKKT